MEEEPVQLGSVLDGRYRIDAVIGSGGMGRVYRGEHTGIGRPVAIKVLHADLGRNREAVTRFQREALASGRLDHTNIVGVTDFGVLDGVGFFLVMEALEGEPLGARIERDKKLPWRDALEIVRGILTGLKHAHDRGVVHRDIKPDNIFLALKEGEPVVKILDFGIAKFYAGSGDDPATTRAGLTVGTPAYLSPEQAVGGDISPASDLYSTTCVLFEMLAGRTPFDGKDPLAMLTSHVSRPPPTLKEIAPETEFPAGLEQLIERGLAKRQGERIGSAAEYLATIHELLGLPLPGVVRGSQPAVVIPRLATAPTEALQTPSPDSLGLPPIAHAVSLGDPPVIPRSWIIKAGIAAGAMLLIGTVAAVWSSVSRTSGPAGVVEIDAGVEPPPKPSPPPPDKPKPKPKAAEIEDKPPEPELHTVAQPTTPPPDDAAFRDAIDQLWKGKTCAARKAAVASLVDVGDTRAVPELQKARHWWHKKNWGLSSDDWNACLTADADAAIKKLGGTSSPSGKTGQSR